MGHYPLSVLTYGKMGYWVKPEVQQNYYSFDAKAMAKERGGRYGQQELKVLGATIPAPNT